MTVTLSGADIAAFSRVAHRLASPLEHASIDDWRSAVNRGLKALLGADTASFLLPNTESALLYSEEHDPTELAKVQAIHPPPPLADGTTIWQHMAIARVATVSSVYGTDIERYRRSAYYNEFAVPSGAQHTLAALLPMEDGDLNAHRVVSVQLSRPGGWGLGNRDFGDREQQLLRLLVPSLAAGAASIRQWGVHRAQLLRTIDVAGQAVLVCDVAGRMLHQTPALTSALAADPEAPGLLAALGQLVSSAAEARRSNGRAPKELLTPMAVDVKTALARYRARATFYSGLTEREPLLLVMLERLTPTAPSIDELRERFALTPSEARVALYLAQGVSNAQLVDALGVSASTARRHTERVLQKLGVHSRAAVAPRIADRS